jgi:creatinine amidohydrolase/Fe(II)-dependent formamide hydrolase-like protein
VPTGAFEAYEPHLPLGSDSLVAANRKSFHRTGTEPVSYIGMDVPGMTPVVTEPGD